MRRCRHRWAIVGKVFRKSDHRFAKVKGDSQEAYDLAASVLSGWTDVSLRCEACGDVAMRQMVGEWKEDG